jgi:hypothetical protein
MYHVKMRPLAFCVVIATALAGASGTLSAQAPTQPKIDVTGNWAFEVQTDAGTGTPQVTFKQEGEKLTGRYSSQALGEADLTGTVKGQAIAFSLTASIQGTSIELTFSGTIETNDAMKGRVSIAGLGEGTFTGKRK